MCDPGGSRVIYSTIVTREGLLQQRRHWLLPLDGSARDPTPLLEGRNVRSVGFTSDGRNVLAGIYENGIRHIFESSFDGQRLRQLTFGGGESEATPSPDGQQLAVFEETADRPIFVLAPGASRPRQITFGHAHTWDLHLAPDGQGVIALIRRDGVNNAEYVALDGSGNRVLASDIQGLSGLDYGGDVYFRRKNLLWRVPLAGGDATPLWHLESTFRIDLDGWVHYQVAANGEASRRMRRLLADGTVEPDPPFPWEYVSVAQVGGWRAAWNDRSPNFALFAPGTDLTGAPTSTIDRVNFSWAPDGRSLLWVDLYNGDIHRRWLADARDEFLQSSDTAEWAGQARDGTLYWTESAVQRRLFMIDNFGNRPPL